MAGNLEVARCFLTWSVDPNLLDSDKCTSLEYAISYDRVPVVRLLLENGAISHQNLRALHQTKSANALRLLLEYGVDPDGSTSFGRTLLCVGPS
jgi:ankyrin repeat protein